MWASPARTPQHRPVPSLAYARITPWSFGPLVLVVVVASRLMSTRVSPLGLVILAQSDSPTPKLYMSYVSVSAESRSFCGEFFLTKSDVGNSFDFCLMDPSAHGGEKPLQAPERPQRAGSARHPMGMPRRCVTKITTGPPKCGVVLELQGN